MRYCIVQKIFDLGGFDFGCGDDEEYGHHRGFLKMVMNTNLIGDYLCNILISHIL